MSNKFVQGIVYIATGKKCLAEAHQNASISKTFTSLPFAIYTDLIHLVDDSIFDFKFQLHNISLSYRDKIPPLKSLFFDRTLFLDSDACLSFSPINLFDLLDTYDICASPSPVRNPPGWSDQNISPLYHELNTGVLLLKKSTRVHSLISDWLSLYDDLFLKYHQSWDQASFRSVLFKAINSNKLLFFTLPSECNLRTTKPWIAGRGSPVYVVHGRFELSELRGFFDYLNVDIDRFRTFSEWLQLFPLSSIRPRFDRTYN